MLTHALVQHLLAGVTEGRVAKVVGECDRLDQILEKCQEELDEFRAEIEARLAEGGEERQRLERSRDREPQLEGRGGADRAEGGGEEWRRNAV